MSLLAVGRSGKSFGGVVAARDVSFTVESGEMVALIGPNGAGKSTIFSMIGGQLRPDRGIVSLDGRAITHASPQERFRLGIGRTFQIAQAFHSMSVRENVQMALISHHHGSLALWHRPASGTASRRRPCWSRLGWRPSEIGPARSLPMGT